MWHLRLGEEKSLTSGLSWKLFSLKNSQQVFVVDEKFQVKQPQNEEKMLVQCMWHVEDFYFSFCGRFENGISCLSNIQHKKI